MKLDLRRCARAIGEAAAPHFRGRVDNVSGVMIEATGVPAAVGELCRIRRGPVGSSNAFVDAEVVGFRGASTLLMPHGDILGIAPNQPVIALKRAFCVPVGRELLGRMVDGFGTPLDKGPRIPELELRGVRTESPDPLSRKPIVEPLQTGVRAIDAFATLGRGQRLGIFAGSGVGKSTLLGQITRGTDAQVIVVCLVGERGREVRAFVDEVLGAENTPKSVMVVATSDRPPIERFMAPFVAVTVAEWFRDQGLDVLLVMDSITRFAAASREIGLAAGEPPTVRGYPPSFFATVPKLVERMGRTQKGSITGLLTILLDGDDVNDPVADTLRGLLDGHLVLSRDLAQRGHYPAVDVLASLSRLLPSLSSEAQRADASVVRGLLAAWKEGRDLVEIGAYKPGTNARLDAAIALRPAVELLLRQGTHETTRLAETRELVGRLAQAAIAQERQASESQTRPLKPGGARGAPQRGKE
ncbi:MAG: FliI/YscN family ATPase [Planctomycetes bacterium]|nr:FliI/YscN family ATPase [Planctomycetota bacterium]